MVSSSDKKSIESEYEKIMKQAKKQPGLKEVMKVYGQYNQLVAQSQAYLGLLGSTETFSDAISADQ